MSDLDPRTLASELAAAYATRQPIDPPSSRFAGFDLDAAYAVEGELARRRRAGGHKTVGLKVGYANKAVWRALKLGTLVWAHMYDDTVRDAPGGSASLSIGTMRAPKIEPEIVFRLKAPIDGDTADAAAVLASVEWLALGFEIIDCVFTDWKFRPPDFVAAYGLHAALVVGPPRRVAAGDIPGLVEQLPSLTVRLSNGGRLVEEGSGRNSLKSPALCLGELAAALARRPGAARLAAGELVSSGTLTESQPISAGETWTAAVDGVDLAGLTLSLSV